MHVANQEILLGEAQIKQRLQELAKQISHDYGKKPFLVVGVLKGAVIFIADLLRELHKTGCSVELDFIQTESYKGTMKGKLTITKDITTEIKGKHILLVDDIFDSGETMEALHTSLAKRGAHVRSVVLLDKQQNRQTKYKPTYIGFTIPHVWVEGYGMDSGQGGRGNPHIVVRKPNG